MKVYIAGISGTGMGPLALMAKTAGIEVMGSDLAAGDVYDELVKAGIEVKIGPQDGKFLTQKLEDMGVDWFVYTSSLPENHAELKLAREAGVRVTKRDDFTAELVKQLGLKMVAVAGTHGKTTTTSMLIWAAKQLGIPAAHLAGTTLSFAPAGTYREGDQFFIYEADEYDRNFLKYHPWLAVIPAVSYDHPDIYPTPEDYAEAFRQFKSQCEKVIERSAGEDSDVTDGRSLRVADNSDFRLAGKVRREDAALAAAAIAQMAPEIPRDKIVQALNEFPGAGRRFEQVAEGIYSDYGHHPEEIAATLDVAADEARLKGFAGVVAIYQPHQNTRQHQVRHGYREAFLQADKVFWLPTYLTREDPTLPVLTPKELIQELKNPEVAEPAELDDALWEQIAAARKANKLVILMTAGPADKWLREKLLSGF